MKRIFSNTRMSFTLAALLAWGGVLASPAAGQDLEIHGFTEGAFGSRIEDNDLMGDTESTMNEARLQLQLSKYGDRGQFFSSVDFTKDNALDGETLTELREAYFQIGLGEHADAKIGRQVLTWGVGDLVFINDLFPKDYISFFVGREDPYLKRPSDAVKLRFFTPVADIDLVTIPYFEPDTLPTGDRLSYYNPFMGGAVGPNSQPAMRRPANSLDNSEIALRAYRYLGNFQGSLYLFRGFYKSPYGMDPAAGSLYYPDLSAYGASVRGPMLSGVVSAEYGMYDSREDRDGDDPFVPNSQHRYLVGYERQWWTDFTGGVQFYGEFMQDHDKYTASLPAGSPESDEIRQLVTARATQQLLYQTLQVSLFAFFSPTDEDWHLRPAVIYKFSDAVSTSVGGNVFGGEETHTLFGQFQDNTNLYTRFRYAF